MTAWTKSDTALYHQQFENLNQFVGNCIDEIVLYLEPTDDGYSEQPNRYGKSLLNGFDIKLANQVFSIGGRYCDSHYGLTISLGQTREFEFIEDEKSPIIYASNIVGKTIKSVEIYWKKIPWNGAVGFYPQEFVFRTDREFLMMSSMEINEGEIDTEFTDEILLIEKEEIAEQFQLGAYGQGRNGRERFNNFQELYDAHKDNWL